MLVAGARSDHVAEIEVAPTDDGERSLAELAIEGCVIAVIRRDDGLVVPKGSTRVHAGDVLTVVGNEEAIRELRGRLALLN